MSHVVQLEVTLNVEVRAHFQPWDRETGHGGLWVVDEIVGMSLQKGEETFDLATSSLLANIITDEFEDELADLYAQQEP